MTPGEMADKCADEVLLVIERDQGIIKSHIAEAIEKVLLKHQTLPAYVAYLERPAIDRDGLCGND